LAKEGAFFFDHRLRGILLRAQKPERRNADHGRGSGHFENGTGPVPDTAWRSVRRLEIRKRIFRGPLQCPGLHGDRPRRVGSDERVFRIELGGDHSGSGVDD